jgi:hypothetical protein
MSINGRFHRFNRSTLLSSDIKSVLMKAEKLTFSGEYHFKRNKGASDVSPQPEGQVEIVIAAFCRFKLFKSV